MKYLILIISLLIGNLNPSFAGRSYISASEIAPPVEKNVKKKQKRVKRMLFKKKRKPNRVSSKGKVTWLIIAGVICAIAAVAFAVIAVLTFISTGLVFDWFIGVVCFFTALTIISFVMAAIYTKNVGVRKSGDGKNEGKATY